VSDPRRGDSAYVAVDAALWQCASTTTERVDPYVRGHERPVLESRRLPWQALIDGSWAALHQVEVDDG
jgi:hypothetical protein